MNADMSFSRILVPLDGSLWSESAIAPAARLARRAGIPLTLFALTYDDAAREILSRNLAALIPTLGGDIKVNVVVDAVRAMMRVDRYIADAIIDEAKTDGALVCMASHGRGGPGVALLGSVTEEVLRSSPRPVVVIGPRVSQTESTEANVLAVCVDGSTFAEHAMAPAAAASHQFGLPLWLVQVADPSGGPPPDLARPSDVRETAYLYGLAASHPGVRNFDVMHSRHPAREIAELPERFPVAMIVMATHGRSGWSRIVLGSVAMNVVHHTTCPVLLVPPTLSADAAAEVEGEPAEARHQDYARLPTIVPTA
jgi:nucleotide-binding universal stress UspA family protein